MSKSISAKIILDSVNNLDGKAKNRLTTLECTFPRFILAEMNTHRVFSRNSASSRAIPISKQIQAVKDDPFIPIKFGRNQKGMQSGEALVGKDRDKAVLTWLSARDSAVDYATLLMEQDVAKEITNRVLEPYMWHTAIISSTEWTNFFEQRCSSSGMAQPEMMCIADVIKNAMDESVPVYVPYEQFHIPYLQDDELSLPLSAKIKLSIARCARVSYLTHDGVRDHSSDFTLYDRLVTGKHYSPFEHVAMSYAFGSGNFRGWMQIRSAVEMGKVNELLEFLDNRIL